MTPEEACNAVGGYVVARYGTGFGEHGRGKVVSYSYVPTFTIETEDGTRFSWRHDLCDVIPEPTAAERTVARFDTFTPEQHAAGIEAARKRRYWERNRRESEAKWAAERMRRESESSPYSSPPSAP